MPSSLPISAAQVAVVAGLVLAVGGVGAFVLADSPMDGPDKQPSDDAAVSTFGSEAEFRSYLQEVDRSDGWYHGRSVGRVEVAVETATRGTPGPTPTPEVAATPGEASFDAAETASAHGGGGGVDRRASDTNVQVEGIDEPDVLKTTSTTLYYSTRGRVVRHHGHREDRPGTRDGVRLVDASDPAAPEVASRLDVSGKLLLVNDTLVVFSGDELVGYDVSNRSDPERTWSEYLTSRVTAARLYAGHVYLVTESDVDRDDPCPIRPMSGVSVPCTDVHHPTDPIPVDSTYTVTVLDPTDGSVEDSTSFVGTAGRSVVYVSPGSVYVTYPKPVDRTDKVLEFLVTNQSDRFDEATLDRLREIRGYDLSGRAKRIEIERAIERWQAGLPREERREAERNLRENMTAWADDHKREFERTGIVEFEIRNPDSDSPSVETGATGAVPGSPLDQFSLDEHEGHLRIATTVGGVMGTDSENDVYVLDSSLDSAGSVKGMGVTERIYSVRFVGDEAYVVTFRRVDPFHVLDLSDPESPSLEGELKLPGYSSYLHPLSDDRVLGIGEEDGKVKLVVFDVSDPTAPTIDDDRVLDTRWSAVAESHHAFLLDRRHDVFFLPTAGERQYHRQPGIPEREYEPRGEGLVFSYENGLTLETAVQTDGPAQRAAYIGDYLYVFGDSSLTVVDERTWNRTSSLDLSTTG